MEGIEGIEGAEGKEGIAFSAFSCLLRLHCLLSPSIPYSSEHTFQCVETIRRIVSTDVLSLKPMRTSASALRFALSAGHQRLGKLEEIPIGVVEVSQNDHSRHFLDVIAAHAISAEMRNRTAHIVAG